MGRNRNSFGLNVVFTMNDLFSLVEEVHYERKVALRIPLSETFFNPELIYKPGALDKEYRHTIIECLTGKSISTEKNSFQINVVHFIWNNYSPFNLFYGFSWNRSSVNGVDSKIIQYNTVLSLSWFNWFFLFDVTLTTFYIMGEIALKRKIGKKIEKFTNTCTKNRQK